ncbi:unnamed protein product [Paramecium sonneborni]|uniref:Uncharacterized protein n=1 Tax=Paramecium sonneborni TaxID=65129 RepID=A0A8S1LYQ6_9CILI|nr:unnamed protein product [Paramecium sonneborni]
MGCSQEKTNKTLQPYMTEPNLRIMIDQLQKYANLNKEKQANEGLQWELQLQQMLHNTQRDKDLEYQLFSKLCQKLKYLETMDFIILHSQILLDQTHVIVRSQGQTQSVQHLIVYIESIIYASQKLNFDRAQQFNNYFQFYFKLDPNDLKKVSPEIMNLHKTPIPSSSEINEYVKKFAQKYGFSQNQINFAGHQFQIEDQNPPQNQISPNFQFNNQLNYPPQSQSQILNNNQNDNNNRNNQQNNLEGNPYYQINPNLQNPQNYAFNLPPHLQPQKPNIKLSLDQKYEKK